MHPYARTIFGIALLALLLAPFTHALTGLYSQTMTWNILANRSHSINYGGTCSSTNFYFNEIDANYDPDNDGNAARVLPSALGRTTGTTLAQSDYNYVNITNPSSSHIVFIGYTSNPLPTTQNGGLNSQLSTAEYTRISTKNGSGAASDYATGQYAIMQATFKNTVHRDKVFALTFKTTFSSILMDSQCTQDAPDGIDADVNVFLWDYNVGVYRKIYTREGSSQVVVSSPDQVDVNSIVDYNITRFIGNDNNITLAIIGGTIGQGSAVNCIYADTIQMFQHYYYDNNLFCQSETMSPFTIYNNGNTDINVDANFSAAFSGTDVNLVLKVWQGTGSGCGTAGMGGWEKDCSVTNTLTDLGMTTCRQYNQTNATTSARLVTQLPALDSNQLCFSGDFNNYTSGGTRAKIFVTTDGNSST